ncbi:MAG: Fe-S cluster assembly ATPase SufC [Candidatus Aenigmarchaeota archaeon]|nr:Fe-S cluster assembly ATPase SufC [Candidatus Aenigmarchaeota archaeon]
MKKLEIKNLHACVQEKEILKGVSLCIKQGEIHALMGPNGSGKSSLANVLMGNPEYCVTSGDMTLDGKSLRSLSPDARSRLGLFLSFQYPAEIPGVHLTNFLRTAINVRRDKKNQVPIPAFHAQLKDAMANLRMDQSFMTRTINEGFSGGEKKRAELLQLALLQPRFAILDEIDSGLDVDALKIVAEEIKRIAGPSIGILIVTHYSHILKYIKPDAVHVMMNGTIVRSGTHELAQHIEGRGYDWLTKQGGL